MGVIDGCIIKADDFLQNYELTIAIHHFVAKEKDDPLYKIVADPEDLKAKPEEANGRFYLFIMCNSLCCFILKADYVISSNYYHFSSSIYIDNY